MSGGLVINGTANSGPIQFQMPVVLRDGVPFAVPAPRGVYNYLPVGLLQWVGYGPAMFDTMPPGRPFQSVPNVLIPLIARGCFPDCNPIRLGQTLAIADAGNTLIERWTVQERAETPFGRMIPMWAGAAYIFPVAGATAPFTITASGFSAGDSWSFSIPGRL